MIMDSLTTRKQRTPIAATCIAMGGCGEADTLDPNALVREAAEARLDRSPPSPSITSPTSADSLTDSTGVIAFEGSASDIRHVARDARVTSVNDHGASGLAMLGVSGKSVTWSTSQISLLGISNVLIIRANDKAGNATECTPAVTHVTPAPAPSASCSTSFSLTVGAWQSLRSGLRNVFQGLDSGAQYFILSKPVAASFPSHDKQRARLRGTVGIAG